MKNKVVNGLLTVFYDGSDIFDWGLSKEMNNKVRFCKELTDEEILSKLSSESQTYFKERWSWEQVIIEQGVTVIPMKTFYGCKYVKRVIFADTVTRIKDSAFAFCKSLVDIKLPLNLEHIGDGAFHSCNLTSVYIPLRCREIKTGAFVANKYLTILNVPDETQLESDIITSTKLYRLALWATESSRNEVINTWIKNINAHDNYALHRACASFRPLKEVIFAIIEDKGLKAFKEENVIDITPSDYLKHNPFAEMTEMEIVREYLSKKFNF